MPVYIQYINDYQGEHYEFSINDRSVKRGTSC